MIGRRFGRWVVIEEGDPVFHGKHRQRFATWQCVCDCGAKKSVLNQSLLNGRSTSCGCYRKEVAADHIRNMNKGGSASPSWKGGRQLTKRGYVEVWVHRDHRFFQMTRSHTGVGGYVFEHRLVMAAALGRPLRDTEEVHHIDGDRANNSLDNLQLRFTKHGAGIAMQCADCGSCNVHPVPLRSSTSALPFGP